MASDRVRRERTSSNSIAISHERNALGETTCRDRYFLARFLEYTRETSISGWVRGGKGTRACIDVCTRAQSSSEASARLGSARNTVERIYDPGLVVHNSEGPARMKLSSRASSCRRGETYRWETMRRINISRVFSLSRSARGTERACVCVGSCERARAHVHREIPGGTRARLRAVFDAAAGSKCRARRGSDQKNWRTIFALSLLWRVRAIILSGRILSRESGYLRQRRGGVGLEALVSREMFDYGLHRGTCRGGQKYYRTLFLHFNEGELGATWRSIRVEVNCLPSRISII